MTNIFIEAVKKGYPHLSFSDAHKLGYVVSEERIDTQYDIVGWEIIHGRTFLFTKRSKHAR